MPIAKQFRRFLRFQFEGKIFEFNCLPNGLSSGPRMFTKLTKPLFAKLREKGHISCIYIDDSILFGDDRMECFQNILDTVEAALDAGFVVHPIKSIFDPTQSLEFLGFIIDSVEMTVTLTTSKAYTLKQMCEQLISYKKTKIITVARVIGKMVAAFPGVQYGPLFYRILDNEKTAALKLNRGNYQAKMKLSMNAKNDLNWWIENIETSFKNITCQPPTITVFSDSSKTGWGGIYGDLSTGGNWSLEESKIHINVLELIAAYYTLASLCRDVRDTHIRIMVDNQTALAYINNMGGKTTLCNKITRQIWDWCLQRNVWISAAYLTSKENKEADEQSRISHSNAEWKLNPDIFNLITKLWGTPDIDLFASRLNHQVNKYCAWKPDPFCMSVDAFLHEWGNDYNYIFPPFSLVGKVLQKIEQDKATAILICPLWLTQSWFSKLLRLLMDCPRYFCREADTMTNPSQPRGKLPKMEILVCLVSGNHSKRRTFQNGQGQSLCPHGGTLLSCSTNHTSRSGKSLQLRGKSILLHPLLET